MALAVPMILFYFLRLQTIGDYFTVASVCFVAWGVADLVATILSKPRLDRQ